MPSIEERPEGELKVIRRRGRGPGVKTVPKRAPRSVSEIWKAVTEEERESAKRQAVELLAYWRGLSGSRQMARILGIKQNRVYLLQQRALAGMVAGLLRPKRDEEAVTVRPETRECQQLKKEVERLTRERDALQTLVRLMRNLPGVPGGREVVRSGGKGEAKRPRDAKDHRDESAGNKAGASGHREGVAGHRTDAAKSAKP